MNTIQLNFINNSNDANNSQIVIFQKNVSNDFDELAVAWKVIENCGRLDNHPFSYPLEVSVGASDSWGNFTPQLDAPEGAAFDLIKDTSGDVLQRSTRPPASSHEIEMHNHLQQGSISAYCYRDGNVCALKTGIAPGQIANFSFKPTIWIGVASEIEQGAVMNSAIISELNTEINLLGITSADIVMTGGGTGPSSQPFTFTLDNINYV